MHPHNCSDFPHARESLQLGSDADIVVFDPHKKWVIEREDLFYKNKHSPFIGMAVTGSRCVNAPGWEACVSKRRNRCSSRSRGVSAPPIFQRG